jgi:hypothetical protein
MADKRKLVRALLLGVMLVVTFQIVSAQRNHKQMERPVSAAPDKDDETDKPSNDIEEEMRAKRAIKYAEKEYQENLDRARDLSSLGTAIVSSFKLRNGLSEEDLKRLEKVEKLAKKIRSAAGGEDDDTIIEKPPKDLPAAMDMLGFLSCSLKEKVESTPRHVISAAVIDEANVLLELIRIVRTMPTKV